MAQIIGTVKAITGIVYIIDGQGNSRVLSIGDTLNSDDKLESSQFSLVRISLSNGSHIVFDSLTNWRLGNSTFRIDRLDSPDELSTPEDPAVLVDESPREGLRISRTNTLFGRVLRTEVFKEFDLLDFNSELDRIASAINLAGLGEEFFTETISRFQNLNEERSFRESSPTIADIALSLITAYADDNNNPTPRVYDFATAGVVGVNTTNLNAVNTLIDAATKEEADTLVEIQALADSGVLVADSALSLISAYALDNSAPTPSLQNYVDAGNTGVNSDNLTIVNAEVDKAIGADADNVAEIQEIIDQVALPRGQFIINLTTAGAQSPPMTVSLDNGSFFSAWYDNVDTNNDVNSLVRGQFFDAAGFSVGAELQIGTSAVEGGSAYDSFTFDVDVMNDGNIIVSWLGEELFDTDGDNTGVVGAIVDAVSYTAGSQFIINTTIAGNQSAPVTVSLLEGGFFTVWHENGITDDDTGSIVRGQFFDETGAKVGVELQIGAAAVEGNNDFDLPPLDVDVQADGNLIVSWHTESVQNVDGDNTGLVAVLINSTDQSLNGQLGLNSTTAGAQSPPVTVSLVDGGFFTAWYDNGDTDNDNLSVVRGQYFNAAGVAVGAELQIGASAVEGSDLFDLPALDVDVLSGGNILVGWLGVSSQDIDGDETAVVGAIINSVDQTAGTQFTMNTTTTGHQSAPVTITLSSSGFFTLWYDNAINNNNTGSIIRGQFFNESGEAVGSELTIGTAAVEGTHTFDLPRVDVDLLSDDKIIVSWQSESVLNLDSDVEAVAGVIVEIPELLVADVFVFGSHKSGLEEVSDFSVAQGDVLDLSDLLEGENETNLAQYLDFNFSAGDTSIAIDNNGDGSGEDIEIVLAQVDLTMGNTLSNADIIADLLANNALVVDN